jgi:hypothetical protein
MFLNPPVGAGSVSALLETIGTMMWRDWEGRLDGFLSDYNAAVAELEEMVEEDEGAASADHRPRRLVPAPPRPVDPPPQPCLHGSPP